MGKGVAVLFAQRYPELRKFIQSEPRDVGMTVPYNLSNELPNLNPVLNLLTKKKSEQKPKRADFNKALQHMREIVVECGIKKVAMPLIGAGLDLLAWEESSMFIRTLFHDVDVEILVCRIDDESLPGFFDVHPDYDSC